MIEKRCICFFCERWESGGIESFLFNTIYAMNSALYTIDIVASEICKSIFTEKLTERGVHFYQLSGKQQLVLKNHRLFRKLLREKQYDVVYLNVFQALSLSYANIAREEGVPVRIAHSHNTALRRSMTMHIKMGIHGVCKRFFCEDATSLAACSKEAAEFMFPRFLLRKKGFTFIPNGIDTQKCRFDPNARALLRKHLGLEGLFVIGNVGRLCYQKNQAFLIRLLPKILKVKPDSRLLLVGEGKDMAELKTMATRMGVADNVTFCGAVEHVEWYLSAMDIFAFPSRFEGLGIAVVEAQAAGLPTIASENIPAEARVTDLFKAVTLETRSWRDAIAAAAPDVEREKYAALVREAGFDVSDTAAGVWKLCNSRSEL